MVALFYTGENRGSERSLTCQRSPGQGRAECQTLIVDSIRTNELQDANRITLVSAIAGSPVNLEAPRTHFWGSPPPKTPVCSCTSPFSCHVASPALPVSFPGFCQFCDALLRVPTPWGKSSVSEPLFWVRASSGKRKGRKPGNSLLLT